MPRKALAPGGSPSAGRTAGRGDPARGLRRTGRELPPLRPQVLHLDAERTTDGAARTVRADEKPGADVVLRQMPIVGAASPARRPGRPRSPPARSGTARARRGPSSGRGAPVKVVLRDERERRRAHGGDVLRDGRAQRFHRDHAERPARGKYPGTAGRPARPRRRAGPTPRTGASPWCAAGRRSPSGRSRCPRAGRRRGRGCRCGQADGSGEAGRAGADDEDVVGPGVVNRHGSLCREGSVVRLRSPPGAAGGSVRSYGVRRRDPATELAAVGDDAIWPAGRHVGLDRAPREEEPAGDLGVRRRPRRSRARTSVSRLVTPSGSAGRRARATSPRPRRVGAPARLSRSRHDAGQLGPRQPARARRGRPQQRDRVAPAVDDRGCRGRPGGTAGAARARPRRGSSASARRRGLVAPARASGGDRVGVAQRGRVGPSQRHRQSAQAPGPRRPGRRPPCAAAPTGRTGAAGRRRGVPRAGQPGSRVALAPGRSCARQQGQGADGASSGAASGQAAGPWMRASAASIPVRSPAAARASATPNALPACTSGMCSQVRPVEERLRRSLHGSRAVLHARSSPRGPPGLRWPEPSESSRLGQRSGRGAVLRRSPAPCSCSVPSPIRAVTCSGTSRCSAATCAARAKAARAAEGLLSRSTRPAMSRASHEHGAGPSAPHRSPRQRRAAPRARRRRRRTRRRPPAAGSGGRPGGRPAGRRPRRHSTAGRSPRCGPAGGTAPRGARPVAEGSAATPASRASPTRPVAVSTVTRSTATAAGGAPVRSAWSSKLLGAAERAGLSDPARANSRKSVAALSCSSPTARSSAARRDVVAPTASQQSLSDAPRHGSSFGREQARATASASRVPPARADRRPPGAGRRPRRPERRRARRSRGCPTTAGSSSQSGSVPATAAARRQPIRDGVEKGEPTPHQRGHRPGDAGSRSTPEADVPSYRLVDELFCQEWQPVGPAQPVQRAGPAAQPTGGQTDRRGPRARPGPAGTAPPCEPVGGGQPIHGRGPRLVVARGCRHEHGYGRGGDRRDSPAARACRRRPSAGPPGRAGTGHRRARPGPGRRPRPGRAPGRRWVPARAPAAVAQPGNRRPRAARYGAGTVPDRGRPRRRGAGPRPAADRRRRTPWPAAQDRHAVAASQPDRLGQQPGLPDSGLADDQQDPAAPLPLPG